MAGVPMRSALAGVATEADEKAVWEAWKIHQTESNRHDVIVAACQKISPTNELIGVSQGLAAWHLMRQGKTNEAATFLENMASTVGKTPLSTAAGEMGRRWLTRLDLEKVKGALQIAYRQDIEYPRTLDALKKLPREWVPPLKDRWDSPWQYEVTGYKRISGLTRQRYRLQCKKLGDDSSLTAALTRPYGARITLKPVSLASTSSGAQAMKFESVGGKAETFLLSEGAQFGGITFAYSGLKLIILTDGDHWLIVPKPKP